MNRTEIAINP